METARRRDVPEVSAGRHTPRGGPHGRPRPGRTSRALDLLATLPASVHSDPVDPHALTCHPATATTAVERIEVRASRAADGVFHLAFTLDGDLSRLRIPPPAPPRVAHDLWRHTCFEAFV